MANDYYMYLKMFVCIQTGPIICTPCRQVIFVSVVGALLLTQMSLCTHICLKYLGVV